MSSSPISPCPSCPPHAAGGHGCAVYSSSVTDAQWAILEPLLPAPGGTAGRGGRPEKHCRRAIVDANLDIAGGGIAWRQLPVEFPPAATVYAVFARWARGGAWQRILDALRDRLRVRAGRDRCPTAAIIDSQTVPGRRHRAPIQPRLRWRQENERPQAAPRRGCERPAARRRRHRRLDPRPRRRTPTPGRTARQLLHHRGWSGPTAVTPDGCSSGRKTFSPLLCRSSNASPAPLVSTSGPAFGWSREVPRGSTSTAAARATTKPEPDHHEAIVHLAMITTMTRRPARTPSQSSTGSAGTTQLRAPVRRRDPLDAQ